MTGGNVSEEVSCEAFGWELSVLPGLGGAVKSLRFAGRDILRPAPANANHPLQCAAFPMIPYSGRIAEARFSFGGREIELNRNFGGELHSIHGQCWLEAWHLSQLEPTRLLLERTHDAENWPWTYQSSQHFELVDGYFRLTLSIRNTDLRPMPVGLGWHPYFSRTDSTRISVLPNYIWPRDAGGIAQSPEPVDLTWRSGSSQLVSELDLDDCFSLDHQIMEIIWPDWSLRVKIIADDVLHYVTLFTPAGDAFCIEPVSHVPNAVNRTSPLDLGGQRVLGPGESFTASIVILPETDYVSRD